MHGKKSCKGESESKQKGKNTAKLLKYYTPCWMLLHLLLVYLYKSEAQKNGEPMYNGVLFSGLIQRAMKSLVTCLFHLYMCVTLFTELFLFINREFEDEENINVTREEEREESDNNSSESECNFELEQIINQNI